MTNLTRLQGLLRSMDWHALLVPSTDEYLSEFPQPFARRLRWSTGFTGSTGLAAVLRDRAALFVDSRYTTQAGCQAIGLEVRDASEAVKLRWLATHLRAGERLALDTRLHSYPEAQSLLGFAADAQLMVIELSHNPIDDLWAGARPPVPASPIFDYPTQYSGASSTEKCAQLRSWLAESGLDWYLACDPEDIAWLLNVRTHDSADGKPGDWHIVPVPLTRALVDAAGHVFWFVASSRLEPTLVARIAGTVTLLEPEQFEEFLRNRLAGTVVGANLRRTPYRFATLVFGVAKLRDDPIIAHRRWVKHPCEVERAREVHRRDGLAVIEFLAWTQRTVRDRTLTEIEAADKIVEFRTRIPGYKGTSEPIMSASGPSGSFPHYVPTHASNRALNDHPLYWIDSGGQYYGGSTDNTVCVALAQPAPDHVLAHTLVVKGFIALTLARFPEGIASTQIDSFARQYLWQHGLDYGHGTGHGVGSFMNIHEGPHIRKEPGHAMVGPLVAGLILSNEPGYYREGDFGIRIESHVVTVPSPGYPGFLEFETLSRLPIDPRLMDVGLLTSIEKTWLAQYHASIWQSYGDSLSEHAREWLRNIADAYADMTA